jgi:hypothetical protein
MVMDKYYNTVTHLNSQNIPSFPIALDVPLIPGSVHMSHLASS